MIHAAGQRQPAVFFVCTKMAERPIGLKLGFRPELIAKKGSEVVQGGFSNPNGFGLLLELFSQELFKVFTLHIVGFEEGANFALHVALAGPFDAVGKAILDRGLAAGLLGGGNRFFGKREVGSFELEIGDDSVSYTHLTLPTKLEV